MISHEIIDAYRTITTATLTSVLLKKGLRKIWIRGAFPLASDQKRVVGPAFTMRFIPGREDLATQESLSSPSSTRAAIEAMPSGCVAVIDSGGCYEAGVLGDILCARMRFKNIAAVVTDGVVRDLEGVLETGLPIWASGSAAPSSFSGMTFINWNEPIGCGGVAVLSQDLIVADSDGAVVVPQNLVEDVLEAATEQERVEAWILEEVRDGAALPGLYPMNEKNRKRYQATRDK